MKPNYFFIVLIAAVAFAGCKATQRLFKSDSRESKRDTSAFVQTAKLDTLKAPKETAKATLPAKWLFDNPGTAYEASEGRAKVSVKLLRDTILAQAECDSLQKVIASINTQLYRLQEQSIEKQTSEVVHTIKAPWQLQLLGYLLAIAFIAYVILSFIKRVKPI